MSVVLRQPTLQVPEPLRPLVDLAFNLRWSWEDATQELFRRIDPAGWESLGDPVRLLGALPASRLEALVADEEFVAKLREVHAGLEDYLSAPSWFQGRGGTMLRSVAYFSPEFGLTEGLPQYSGGLGVLAGDHLKAASGLGVPLVAVGLLYRSGYFRQRLEYHGWQREAYPSLDPEEMALRLVDGVRVDIELADVPVVAQVWKAEVGRVPLYLLDTDVPYNDEHARRVTDALYSGDVDHRIRQEIFLGMGGVRALEALGESPNVFHSNEGHAGFLALERLGRLIVGEGLSFDEAVERVRVGTVFTTHTPVAAGIDRFPRPLMERYFGRWTERCGIPFDTLMALGQAPGEGRDAAFNMAYMALRLSARANGVSMLHGQVSRSMFAPLWPGRSADEVPISSVTNGVHGRSWVSPEMHGLLQRYVSPKWAEADSWEGIDETPDEELWAVRAAGRQRLVSFVRRRLAATPGAGGSAISPDWVEGVMDPNALTIGFARRFAAYKRATLLMQHPERLKALLNTPDRPVQIIFSGKAHPADEQGKHMIRELVEFARDPQVRARMAFIEDFDIGVARMLYQGSDVWLNNPWRPLEACGTSGQKAALNAVLNCSILDGWWAEMYEPAVGWAIPSAEDVGDPTERNRRESQSLLDIVEHELIPLFYERDASGLPRRWLRRMKNALRLLGPRVNAHRMVREYVERMYEPALALERPVPAPGA
ncbi:MAG: alpha-glucan family phosphorylase [Actinomycetota bacterium]